MKINNGRYSAAIIGAIIGILATLALFAPKILAHDRAIDRNEADIRLMASSIQEILRDMVISEDLDRLKADLIRELGK